MKRLMFILVCLIIVSPAKAALTGNDLYRFCTNANSQVSQDACNFWVAGFIAGVSAASDDPPRYVCLPDGVDFRLVRVLIENFMENHPQALHRPARELAYLALEWGFPCPVENRMLR